MATPAYIPIYTTTLASAASSVLLNGIPQDYRDLVLVAETGHSSGGGDVALRLNGDASTNYQQVVMRGNGSSASSFTVATNYLRMSVNDPASGEKHLLRADLMDYSATDKHTTVLSRSDNSADSTGAIASRHASTSAVVTLELFMQYGANFDAGTTVSLYGILGTE